MPRRWTTCAEGVAAAGGCHLSVMSLLRAHQPDR
jgi:hypothetical protein